MNFNQIIHFNRLFDVRKKYIPIKGFVIIFIDYKIDSIRSYFFYIINQFIQ